MINENTTSTLLNDSKSEYSLRLIITCNDFETITFPITITDPNFTCAQLISQVLFYTNYR